MPILYGLGFKEEDVVVVFDYSQAQHIENTHDLPSFRLPKEKPYVTLVLVSIDEITRAVKIGYGGVARVWCLVCTSF
jgi:hypothetical protein